MKKFILGLISISVFFTVPFASVHATLEEQNFFYIESNSEESEDKEPTFEQIEEIYREILKTYQYDESLDSTIPNNEIKNVYLSDVEFVKNNRKGGSRQLSSFLISRLKEFGIEASYIERTSDDCSRFAVLYRLGNESYVADFALELQEPRLCSCRAERLHNDPEKPKYFNFPLHMYEQIFGSNKWVLTSLHVF